MRNVTMEVVSIYTVYYSYKISSRYSTYIVKNGLSEKSAWQDNESNRQQWRDMVHHVADSCQEHSTWHNMKMTYVNNTFSHSKMKS